MIQDVKQYPISYIFGDNKVRYVVPKFQREYVWRKEEWGELFEDLQENDSGYFLGSIICVDKGHGAFGVRPLELIDGQQRIVTLSLIFAAIYQKFLKINRKDEEFITEKNNLKYKMILKNSGKEELKTYPSLLNDNLEVYQAILKEIEIFKTKIIISNLGNKRLYKAYKFFKDKMASFDYTALYNFLNKVNEAVLVMIEVKSEADAFTLFESLNNRGIALSAVDIIKNNVLSAFDKKKTKSIDEAFEEWDDLIRLLPDYTVQERFLRQYFNAYRYKYKKQIKEKKFNKAMRSNLIKIYEELIKEDVDYIFNELKAKSKIYNYFIDPQNAKGDCYHPVGLMDLLNVKAAPAYTFLLYLFSEHANRKKLIEESIDFLVKYFVRRNLTDFPATRDLDLIFMGLIKKCNKTDSPSISDIFDYLTANDRFSTIIDFEEKLKGDIYEENADVTRFILCSLEKDKHAPKEFPDLWKKESDKFIFTIEHVFPAGTNIPDEWVDMMANGDHEKAKKLQNEWVHKLGNLTLTAYNPNLSNFSFKKKRDRKDQRGNFIGYQNGFFLNEDLKEQTEWTPNKIEKRTNRLVKEALNYFSLKGESH